jgi:sporulation protein YlmC with PRC-barrel domain
MGEYRSIKDLTNKAVVSATNGQKIASVSDVMIDPAALRVAALMISGGTVFRPERQLILADAVTLWGQDVILVKGTDVIVRDLDVQRDDGWLQAADYLRRRSVVGTDGRRLGRVCAGAPATGWGLRQACRGGRQRWRVRTIARCLATVRPCPDLTR